MAGFSAILSGGRRWMVLGAAALLLTLAGCTSALVPRSEREEPRPPLLDPRALDLLDAGFVAPRFPGLNPIDRRRAAETLLTSLESGREGQPNPWRNPDSRNAGETIPGPAAPAEGARCRSFVHTATINGMPQRAEGRACRAPDGRWQPM